MRRALFCIVAALNLHGDCGGGTGCPPEPMLGPMTSARAAQIAPGVATGLAVSTTHVFGDCRPIEVGESSSCETNPLCARDRVPMRVFVVEVNQSIPVDPDCGGAFDVAALASRAAFDGRASDDGELVVGLEAGHYTVYASADDRCAVCGFTASDGSCRVEIFSGRVTARDLVVDEAAH